MDIYEEVIRSKREGRSCAVATIVQCSGSSPQKEGAKMLVRHDGSTLGTIGGGCIEDEVIQLSMMAIQNGSPMTAPINLSEKEGGLICGGKLLVYIEPFVPDPAIVILGAGHVGKAVSSLARFAGFHVTVTDDRDDYANRDNLPHATTITVSDFDDIFSKVAVTGATYIVIATRGHNHDLVALKAALRTDATYIGLLGSKRKRAILFKSLKQEGFTQEDIDRVIVPVGLPIGSVTPEEIAVSIMAQIIQKRREHGAPHIGHSSRCGSVGEDGSVQTAPSSRG